jgi:TPR repeat protein
MFDELLSVIHGINPFVGIAILGLILVAIIAWMIYDLMPHHMFMKSRPLTKYGRTRRKAMRGDAKACIAVAKMLEKGSDGAPHNPHRAELYWQHAATYYFHDGRHGDPYGYLMLADIMNRHNRYPHISKDADRYYRLALRGFEQMAEEGKTNGYVFAGYQYRWGLGCITDHDRAAKYLEAAAKAGHPGSMKSLAELYLTGYNAKPKPDPVGAANWLRQAAMRGDAEARERVGDNYLSSLGEGGSREMAYFWYTLAARQGRRDAMQKLAAIEHDWTPKQLREVQASMQRWMASPTALPSGA